HHRVAPGAPYGHRGVHAAVVELDPLADAVGARAEDHDRVALRARRLALGAGLAAGPLLPARVEVRRLRWELRGAGVDRAERALPLERRLRVGGELGQLREEPGVDAGALAHVLGAHTAPQQLEDRLEAVRRRRAQALQQLAVVHAVERRGLVELA